MARKRPSDDAAARKRAAAPSRPRRRGAPRSRILWIGALLLAAVAAAAAFLSRDREQPSATAETAAPGAPVPLSEAGELDAGPRRTAVADARMIDVSDDPRKGSPQAPVRIVEFADFQCPSCGQFFATTGGALASLYGDRIEWVFVDLPLTQIHNRALPAAIGGECAARQDKFWPYHDLVFQNQNRLMDGDLRGYAERAGVDVDAWEACIESDEARAAVERDVELANELGVTGTPTFFVGPERIQGNAPITSFMEVIDPLLQGTGAPAAAPEPAAPPAGD